MRAETSTRPRYCIQPHLPAASLRNSLTTVKRIRTTSEPPSPAYSPPEEVAYRDIGGYFWQMMDPAVDRSSSSTDSNGTKIQDTELIPLPRAAASATTPTDNSPTLETHIGINLVPPLNFSLVEDGIYRSGFPMPINYPFLQQVNLKTIIYLGDLGHQDHESPSSSDNSNKKKKKKKKDKDGSVDILNQYIEWIESQETITFHNLQVESSQEPFNKPEEQEQTLQSLTTALQLILDKSNYPILIHSNKGKHRTGLLVGLMRNLLQGWCLSGIFEEYEKFAMGKFEYDLELIEIWQPELWVDDSKKPNFVRI
ncbi:uncharacterized protein LODBEIA_P37710 [Lodderomyces beijingensis]|uniref:Uncharacterized protein n=1 Tax=Lodderomyces beijingensis TaxID=1775926 RepID=A0ABP0ZQE2_9ASCO